MDECVDQNSIYILPSGEIFTSYTPAPYVNQLEKVGYEFGTLSQSQNTYGEFVSSDNDIYATTGFIPISSGDIIYFKNMSGFYNWTTSNKTSGAEPNGDGERIMIYDSSKDPYIWQTGHLDPTRDIDSNIYQRTYNSENSSLATKIISTKITYPNVAYCRITFIYRPTDSPKLEQSYYFDSNNSIITVNEDPNNSIAQRKFGKTGYKLTPVTE